MAEKALTKATFTVEMLLSYQQILMDSFEKKFETHASHVNLLRLIENTVKSLQPVTEDQQIKLVTEVRPQDKAFFYMVFCDEHFCKRIFKFLLGFAI